jgi:hypothetical protein
LEKQRRRNTVGGNTIIDNSSGLPLPSLTGGVLRGVGPDGVGPLRKPIWTYEWQGLMPEYWVSLDPAGASYYVTGLTGVQPVDAEQAKALLPALSFNDGGLTLNRIGIGGYPDVPTTGFAAAQSPVHLYVDVNPSFDGEAFTINLPMFDNGLGTTTPFYTFDLTNIGAFNAVINILDTALFYEGTLTPVMGDPETWTIEPGFQAAWFVKNVKGWGATATPSVYWDGTTASFTDAYYQANVYNP